jgi:hypothetical protein
MSARKIDLQLARVHDHVRDLLKLAGQADLLERSSCGVDDAYQVCKARLESLNAADDPNGERAPG